MNKILYLNWKANCVNINKYYEEISKENLLPGNRNIGFFVPIVYIETMKALFNRTDFILGAQNCVLN